MLERLKGVEKQNGSRRSYPNHSRTFRSRSLNRRHCSERSNHTPSPHGHHERSRGRERTPSNNRHMLRSLRSGHRSSDNSYRRRDSPRDQALGRILARLNSIEDVTDKVVDACLVQERSHNFYFSHFDPNLHDFDVLCSEVDRARILNKWDDRVVWGAYENVCEGTRSHSFTIG